jgi:coenzyme F420 biosynthesis associated uncharacterized protein
VSTAPASPAEIDWELAGRRAARVARPGPRADRGELEALVAELRQAARLAPDHVAGVTGLERAAAAAAAGPVLVIDRPRWAEVNLQMFRHLLEGAATLPPHPGAGRLAAEELGMVLGLLSSRVLGQFDPFTPHGPVGATGRLVLVAPNVLHVERQLRLDPGDFRLWVCLHEQTHAVQFAAAPWLPEHLGARVRELLAGFEDSERAEDRLRALLQALPRVLRGVAAPGDGAPDPAASAASGSALLDVVLDEDERRAVASAVAVMTLLEGHADVVMDAVGPEVIRSLRRIRAKFEARRDSRRPMDLLLRRVLGLDAKVAQYRTGAAFVRSVVDAVGHEGLNAVWSGPESLPSAAEIREPAAWVRRVHG